MTLDRKIQSISLDPTTLKEGRERAEELKLNFSAYIYHLIRRDLEERGDFLIKPPCSAGSAKKKTGAKNPV